MIRDCDKTVVLMYGSGRGVVVNSGSNADSYIGFASTLWVRGDFKLYEGSVCLEN